MTEPKLTGSDKQVAWAEQIRAEWLAKWDAAEQYAREDVARGAAEPVRAAAQRMLGLLPRAREALARVADAKAFIDARTLDPRAALAAAAGEYPPLKGKGPELKAAYRALAEACGHREAYLLATTRQG